jgi:hypothetical protein
MEIKNITEMKKGKTYLLKQTKFTIDTNAFFSEEMIGYECFKVYKIKKSGVITDKNQIITNLTIKKGCYLFSEEKVRELRQELKDVYIKKYFLFLNNEISFDYLKICALKEAIEIYNKKSCVWSGLDSDKNTFQLFE